MIMMTMATMMTMTTMLQWYKGIWLRQPKNESCALPARSQPFTSSGGGFSHFWPKEILPKNYRLEHFLTDFITWTFAQQGQKWRFCHKTQGFLTRSRKIKLSEPSEGIFRDPTKYWTIKKNCKIGPLGPKEKIDFFSFFLMRQRLSSGQRWFLRPYFPLIRGMFVFRSGLRFLFRAPSDHCLPVL